MLYKYNSIFEDYRIHFTRYISFLDFEYYPTNNIVTTKLIFFITLIIYFLYIYNTKKNNNFFFLFFIFYIYDVVADLVLKYLGKSYLSYAPFFTFLFLCIFFFNIFGILPFVFTETSHIIFTFFLASIVWYSILIKGLLYKGIHFFGMFTPKGVPTAVIPLLIFIESLSYFFR